MRYSRIREGEIWDDPAGRHRVGCLDAAQTADVSRLMLGEKAALAIQDPPYNQVAFEERNVAHFIDWCRHWIAVTDEALAENASLYVWMGADQKQDFQPLPDFMLDDARDRFSRAQPDHRSQSTRLWYAQELDGGPSRAAVLREGQS